MGSFFRKDLLVFWRDRKEILMALLLPIVIIFVLNLAFSGLFEKDAESLHLDVAILYHDRESVGLEQFKETVEGLTVSQTEKEAILEQATAIKPLHLMNEFLITPELKEWLNIQEMSEEDAKALVKEGDLDAIILVPEGFTHGILSQLLLGEQSEAILTIQAEEQSTELSVLQNIVGNFIDTVNLQFAIGSTAGAEMTEPVLPQGGEEVIEGVKTFTMTQYFTIAMSSLFALFISQTVAMKTITEKRERVFNRMILTDSNPLSFLMGKTMATFCLSWLQMVITFTATQLILDVFPEETWKFWLGVLVIITTFALTVAGLSALFTSLTLNIADTNAVSGITTLIIMLFGVLGGNFTPIQSLPVFMQKVGEWTPNGLTQTAFIEWIQYSNMQDLIVPVVTHSVFFGVCLMIATTVFPRRGRV